MKVIRILLFSVTSNSFSKLVQNEASDNTNTETSITAEKDDISASATVGTGDVAKNDEEVNTGIDSNEVNML